MLLLDCERHTELVGLCQVALCRAVPGCCASRYTRTAGCPFLSPAASAAAHPLLQAGCWPSACCCVVLQDDAGPGLEEPASSLQLAQLRLQEQLDARACARLCWLQMEGPYRLCRLGPYIFSTLPRASAAADPPGSTALLSYPPPPAATSCPLPCPLPCR